MGYIIWALYDAASDGRLAQWYRTGLAGDSCQVRLPVVLENVH